MKFLRDISRIRYLDCLCFKAIPMNIQSSLFSGLNKAIELIPTQAKVNKLSAASPATV